MNTILKSKNLILTLLLSCSFDKTNIFGFDLVCLSSNNIACIVSDKGHNEVMGTKKSLTGPHKIADSTDFTFNCRGSSERIEHYICYCGRLA